MDILKKIYGIFLKILIILFGIDYAKKFDTKLRFKRNLDLKNPKSLADKVTYIELHKQSKLASICTDKYEVRNYVEEKGLKDILVPLIGGPWSNIEEIEFDKLPSSFVIKATHGCKMNYLVPDKEKFDLNDCKKNIKKWLKITYGTYSIEPHYLEIFPRVYAEKYLKEIDGLIDYKFHCINGKVEFILVCSERKYRKKDGKMELYLDLYDSQWNPIFEVVTLGTEKAGKGDIKKPILLDRMKNIAEILSKDFSFVRVDLYQLQEKIYFGELTFSPACCVFPYLTEKFLLEQGKKLKI